VINMDVVSRLPDEVAQCRDVLGVHGVRSAGDRHAGQLLFEYRKEETTKNT
jgi:hypothetical protein